MLSYETISDALLDSAEEVGLNVWQSDEQLDPHTLQRTFRLSCLPPGLTAPRPHSAQVNLQFRWDAAMTAISTLGTDALCKLYHGDNVACAHDLTGCAYEATLSLEITYTVPVVLALGEDATASTRLIRGIQDLHRGMVDHKNIVTVDAEVQMLGGELRVRQLRARQLWPIGDPLHDLDSLSDVFEEVCSEVRDFLTALTYQIAGDDKTSDGDDSQPMLFDADEDRIYLRPPTA